MSHKVYQELKDLETESRNPRTAGLDVMSVREILEAMNREDRTVAEVVSDALPEVEKAAKAAETAFRQGGRLIYVGAGTSGRLGVLDASECPPTFGADPEQVRGVIAGGYGALVKSAEGAEDEEETAARDLRSLSLKPEDVVCGITASRRTPYVISALRFAKNTRCRTILIICNSIPENYLELSDIIISLPVGPEILTGSTRLKAGTATKMVLNMITTSAMIRQGKCYENLMVDLKIWSDKLRARARRILTEITGLDYGAADALLKSADGELKTAIVMHLKDLNADRAREALNESGGVIRKAIE